MLMMDILKTLLWFFTLIFKGSKLNFPQIKYKFLYFVLVFKADPNSFHSFTFLLHELTVFFYYFSLIFFSDPPSNVI